MLKVLRKYNKWILVVGGTLLLISFLVPQAIQQMGQARLGRAVGTMDGRKITLATYDQARRELAALSEFFSRFGGSVPLPLDEKHEVEHWMLLSREAEKAGMVGGANEGATLLPIFARTLAEQSFIREYMQFGSAYAQQLAAYQMQQNPDEVQRRTQQAEEMLVEASYRAAGATGMIPEEFNKTLGKLRGVDRLLSAYQTAERISDQQAITIAKGLADTVLVDSVFLSARELADETLEPAPEELRSHFERFREVRPGEGEFGIGYLLGPRVKLAWIELSRPAVQQAISVPLLDATKHYQQNRDRFPEPFEAERERVEAELRAAKVNEVMEAAENVVRAEIAQAVRPLARDGEYRVLPDDWAARRPDFVRIADQVVAAVAESEGVNIPTPAVHVRDERWLNDRLLAQLPGIGVSTVRFGQRRFPFPQLALAVRELGGDPVLGLQVGVPAVDLTAEGRDGSRYYYNILDAAPEGVPEALDHVMEPEQVIEDWRALRTYETLAASGAELASRAASEGLEDFAKSFGTLEPEPAIPEGAEPPEPAQRVSVRRNATVYEDRAMGLGQADSSDAAISEIRARAATIDPLTPIDTVPIPERTVAVPLPAQLGVLVAQINGVQPLTWETLPMFADRAAQVHWQRTFQSVGIPFPFRFEALKERHAFTMKTPEDEGGEADEG